MNKREWTLLAIGLTLAAVILHSIHFLVFQDAHHIFIYLVGDIAFVPLEVLFIIVIVERLLSERERRSRQHKMNMVIGAFFSATGGSLLRAMAPLVANRNELASHLAIGPDSTEADIRRGAQVVHDTPIELHPDTCGLVPLRDALVAQRAFMLQLLQNPNLLEHESFTDMLWALFHLEEELGARSSFGSLPESDVAHLRGDMDRAYSALLAQWLEYLVHLKRDYPYLFSFAARTNPWRPDARVEVT